MFTITNHYLFNFIYTTYYINLSSILSENKNKYFVHHSELYHDFMGCAYTLHNIDRHEQ